MKLLFFLIFLPIICLSQQIKINLIIKNTEDRGIDNASVVVLDNDDNTVYFGITNEIGFIACDFNRGNLKQLKIEITSLGFKKKQFVLELSAEEKYILNFVLDNDIQVLKEVVLEANQKIRINKDTTYIKVDKFTNKTEQTLEDVLKKLPGIVVNPDGSIKAHGKPIDKLLVDGEDVFDKNYKLLSKNLDAKVIDEVQILDNFEDNPILKKLSDSDKVAINIKFKNGYDNVWFGNTTLGLGTESRFKESINLGLLRKKIKLFYFGDYNNIGEKGSTQIMENQESISFSDFNQKVEKKTSSIYLIESNENTQFSNSQSLFNKAFSNSVSTSSKLNKKLKIRSVNYFINDIQNQNSSSFTQYNFNDNPISFTENSEYKNNKTLASSEIELKFLSNENNYISNYTVYKNIPDNTSGFLFFNTNAINQNSKTSNLSFYNHLEHTFEIAENKVLKNYFYFGFNQINQTATVSSSLLNDFLNNESNINVLQTATNKLMNYGVRSTLLMTKGNFISNSTIQYNNENEILNSDLTNENAFNFNEYKNRNSFKQHAFLIEEKIKYAFSRETSISSKSSILNNDFNGKSFFLFNQNVDFEFLIKKIGRFNFGFSYNSNLPENQILTQNSQLVSYRSFNKGAAEIIKINTTNYRLTYNLFNDVKRFSVNASLLYSKKSKNYITENTINQNFNFSNYIPFRGGELMIGTIALTNYFRKLKLATKLETNQNLIINPVQINDAAIINMENYNSIYRFSGTTYFSKICNFDFGFNYNFFQSKYANNISKNETNDFFISSNYTISEVFNLELKSSVYFINSNNYKFFNINGSYNPKNSRYTFSVLLNNLANEKNFTTQSISSFSFYSTSINLVPRYFLSTIKYRF